MNRTTNILPAAVANGVSSAILVKDDDTSVFSVHTTGATTATVKFLIGYGDTQPDFSVASSKDNDWHYANTIDVVDGVSKDGDTGVSISGTLHNAYLLNVDIASWAGVEVTGMSAGALDVLLTRTNTNFK